MKIWLTALLPLLLLTGCPKIVPTDPPMTTGMVYEDLPAPQGFVYDVNFTNTNPTGDFRILTQDLRGKDRRVEPTVKFYKEIFPTKGWTLESEAGEPPGEVKLVFKKKSEVCRIGVRDEKSTNTFVTLRVGLKE